LPVVPGSSSTENDSHRAEAPTPAAAVVSIKNTESRMFDAPTDASPKPLAAAVIAGSTSATPNTIAGPSTGPAVLVVTDAKVSAGDGEEPQGEQDIPLNQLSTDDDTALSNVSHMLAVLKQHVSKSKQKYALRIHFVYRYLCSFLIILFYLLHIGRYALIIYRQSQARLNIQIPATAAATSNVSSSGQANGSVHSPVFSSSTLRTLSLGDERGSFGGGIDSSSNDSLSSSKSEKVRARVGEFENHMMHHSSSFSGPGARPISTNQHHALALIDQLRLDLRLKEADNRFLQDDLAEKDQMLAVVTEGLKEVSLLSCH
jgi:hypothetical protein